METVGERIKAVLKEKKLRQIHLSDGTGIPKSTLSEIITGKKKTSFENMQLISEFLDIDLHWLVKGNAYKEHPGYSGQVAEIAGKDQYNQLKPKGSDVASNVLPRKFQLKYIPEILEILSTLNEEERHFVLEMVERLKKKDSK